MNIFDINKLIYEALAANDGEIDSETGIVLDSNLLDKLELAREQKIEGALLFKKQLEANASAMKEQAKKINERAKAIENRADNLEDYVISQLEEFGDKKFESHKIRATMRENIGTNIVDQSKIPEQYLKTVTEVKPITNDIKAALKAGIDVPGAELKISKSLTIK